MSTQNDVESTRAGFVALVGLPNAGKSSLMNRLLDQPLSIVTATPQTTRLPITGIDTRDRVQMIFVDTPGLVEPQYLLHRAMLTMALETIGKVDAVVLVADGASGRPPQLPDAVRAALEGASPGLIVAITKSDRAAPETIAATTEWAEELNPQSIVLTSSVSGSGLDRLRAAITQLLPHSPYLYPEDEVSSQPVRFFVSEFIREAVLALYQQEIPHSLFAEVDEFREGTEPLYIRATIYVERDSQKRIIIGQGGKAIRALGLKARKRIEDFVGGPVYLDLWVKVLPKWRRHAASLKRLGFTLPNQEG